MPPKNYWNIRRTPRREAQIAALGQITGLGDEFAAVVDFALAASLAQYRQEETMTEERYTQKQEMVVEALGADNLEHVRKTFTGMNENQVHNWMVECFGEADIELRGAILDVCQE